MVSSPYCLAEVGKNVIKLGDDAERFWREGMLPSLDRVDDRVVLDKPLLLSKVKDKPVLIAALAAQCDILLTLDRANFAPFFARGVYGLRVMTPGAFLKRQL